jgi:hypothetical protein
LSIGAYAIDDTANSQDVVRGFCYKRQDGTSTLFNSNTGVTNEDECTEEQFNSLNRGDWMIRFANSDVRGSSVCSNIVPPIAQKVMDGQVDDETLEYYNPLSFHDLGLVATEESDINTLNSLWVSQKTGEKLGPDMFYCWCKSESSQNSPWVYADAFGLSVEMDYGVQKCDSSFCASFCAAYCADSVRENTEFRDAIFGAKAQ